jgi:hypothetical protein
MTYQPLNYNAPNALNELIKRVVELREYFQHLNVTSFPLPANELDILYKHLAEFDKSIEQVDWMLANDIFKLPIQDNQRDLFVRYVKFRLYEILLIDHEKKLKQKMTLSQHCARVVRYTLAGATALLLRWSINVGYDLLFKK